MHLFETEVRLKLSKCVLGVWEVRVLGHGLTKDGIWLSESHSSAIKLYRSPHQEKS